MEEIMKVSMRILASLAAALLFGIGVRAQVPAQSPAAATVNGEAISETEVQAVVKVSVGTTPTTLTAEQQKEMRANALNLLIEDLLMRQYLRKNAPAANPQDVEKEVRELAEALAKEKK